MLHCHLYGNSKCYFSSWETNWQKQPPEVFYKKDVLTNFWTFTGKHLCQSLFFKRLYYRFFPVNFPNFVGPLFLQNTFERLLLYLVPCQMSMKEIFCGNSKSLTVFAKKKKPYVYFYKGSNHVLLVVSCSCIVNKITWRYSSSRSQMFLKIGVLKSFAYFTGKQLHWNFFFIKLKALSPATLLKKESNSGVFLWNLWKF